MNQLKPAQVEQAGSIFPRLLKPAEVVPDQPLKHRLATTDVIVVQRYVEIDGRLKRALAIVKARPRQHREYEISDGEIVLLTGTPRAGSS